MAKEDTYSYKGWLNSDSFVKRAFAIFGYAILGQMFVGLIFISIVVVVSLIRFLAAA